MVDTPSLSWRDNDAAEELDELRSSLDDPSPVTGWAAK